MNRQITPAERASLPKLVGKRIIPSAGHFLPHEMPEPVATAVIDVLTAAK